MARVKVKVERGNGLQQVVVIDTAATQGARLGRDVYLPDGAVATPTSMRNWLGVSQGTAAAPTTGSSLSSVLTAKGDLATRNSQVQRLGIGTQDQALRVSAAGLPEWRSGAALTKQDDTNVTLTLNGEPGNALLDGVELELGWEGTLAPDRGGWGADISAADGYAKFTDGVASFSNTVPWADISDTPDTLAGYGITDAYTIAQVDALFTDMENYFLPDNYQPLSATLTDLAMLGDAEGVLTNDGYGNLSWGSGGSTYTAGDGLTLAGDKFSVDEAFNFTWTGQHIFSGAEPVTISSTGPGLRLLENDADADKQRWKVEAYSGGTFGIWAYNDAETVYRSVLQAVRGTGPAITDITYGNSTDLPGHYFYGDFLGNNNTFGGLPAYQGTTTGISIGKDSTYPAMWSYRDAAPTNEKRWAWYHGLQDGGDMQLLAWTDNASDYRAAIGVFRSGVAITDIVLGNSTDEPVHTFYGPAIFRGDPSSSAVHARAYSPDGAAYLGAFSDASSGEVGINLTDGTRTWYMYHTGGALNWYTGGVVQASLSADSNFLLNGAPVPRIISGGAAGGGRITISTSAPSGTPADGDFWIQNGIWVGGSGAWGAVANSGTYTPTGTAGTAVSSVTPAECQYIRIGDVVTVSGRASVSVSSGGAAVFYLSLPVASALTQQYQLAGTAAAIESGVDTMAVFADTANDRAQFQASINAGSKTYYFTFTYRIV